MPSPQDQETATAGATAGHPVSPSLAVAVEPARQNFKVLLLANPNHFGNLAQSAFKAVQPLALDTRYEELVCLGLDTDFNRLEAVIEIKQDSGYLGGVCSPGSHEYVRFYADLQNDGVWVDLGVASANVCDIAGNKPLCYGVSLDFTPFRKLCTSENLIPVRAILSWSVPPPANAPGFTPVWGNALSAEVQIRPVTWVLWPEIPVQLAPAVQAAFALVEPTTKLPLKPPAKLSVTDKAALYHSQDVPPHRFAFSEAQALLGANTLSPSLLAGGGQSPLAALGLSAVQAAQLVDNVLSVNGDTSYEELRCAGLRTDSDQLEGVLTLKRSAGYSGSLCTTGSVEYVAFYMDFGAGFVHAGTGAVNVHDLSTIPAEGLQYAVFAKCDLSPWTTPCTAGPRVVRLRAILSWETPPPAGNPNFVPVWGNRIECNVQLRPGQPLAGHQPLIETVGNMDVANIDAASGLASGPGVGAAFTATQSPFGGVIEITGRIGNPPAFSPATKLRYRIEVTRIGAASWQPLTNQVTVSYSRWAGGAPLLCAPLEYVCTRTLVPSNDGDGLGDGWYDYIEDLQSPTQTWLVEDLLASWQTAPSMEGLWQLRMVVKDMSVPSGLRQPIYGPQIISVEIDNTAPAVDLEITGATFNGQPVPAANCGRFPKGTVLSGTYSVSDQHFGSLSIELEPAAPADGAAVQLTSALPPIFTTRSYPTVPTTGESSTWKLDTSAMQACGYVLRLIGTDRTIYDSGFVGLTNDLYRGFCVVDPPPAG